MAKKGSKSSLANEFSKAASSGSTRVHIVPSRDGWSVKREGAKRSSSVKATKKSALKAARNIKSADRIVIHKKDGTIQRNSKKG